MDAVRAFNLELSSLYEIKPPISRAKMASLTKLAVKAIKFYKHVVQSVEKFVAKCNPNYKVPGLYVIDSIVRQSRHQFGPAKDVFVPRFIKNIAVTFQHLFKCPSEVKNKIVRVLNLWQKNGVFPSEVIQPLLDMAGDPNSPVALQAVQGAVDKFFSGKQSIKPAPGARQALDNDSTASQGLILADGGVEPVSNTGFRSGGGVGQGPLNTNQHEAARGQFGVDVSQTVAQLLHSAQQAPSLSAQQQQLQQLQMLQQQLLQQTKIITTPQLSAPLPQPAIDNTLIAQIQLLTNQLLTKSQETSPQAPTFNKKLLDFDYGESDEEELPPAEPQQTSGVQTLLSDPSLMQQIQQMSQDLQKTEQLRSELHAEEMRQKILQQQQDEFDQQITLAQNAGFLAPPPVLPGQPQEYTPQIPQEAPPHPPQLPQDELDKSHRSRDRKTKRSRSRSRSPGKKRKKRSRSRDRSRRSRDTDRRRRSRSRGRDRERDRLSKEDREKDRERRKKGLPPVKEKHLSEPRGCAFVVLEKRKDACKIVEKLKGAVLLGNNLKTSWAQGKGVKDMYGDFWDKDEGVTYIPFDKIPRELNQLTDGGVIDDESLPEDLRPAKQEDIQTSAMSDVMSDGIPSSMSSLLGQPLMVPQAHGGPLMQQHMADLQHMSVLGLRPPMGGQMSQPVNDHRLFMPHDQPPSQPPTVQSPLAQQNHGIPQYAPGMVPILQGMPPRLPPGMLLPGQMPPGGLAVPHGFPPQMMQHMIQVPRGPIQLPMPYQQGLVLPAGFRPPASVEQVLNRMASDDSQTDGNPQLAKAIENIVSHSSEIKAATIQNPGFRGPRPGGFGNLPGVRLPITGIRPLMDSHVPVQTFGGMQPEAMDMDEETTDPEDELPQSQEENDTMPFMGSRMHGYQSPSGGPRGPQRMPPPHGMMVRSRYPSPATRGNRMDSRPRFQGRPQYPQRFQRGPHSGYGNRGGHHDDQQCRWSGENEDGRRDRTWRGRDGEDRMDDRPYNRYNDRLNEERRHSHHPDDSRGQDRRDEGRQFRERLQQDHLPPVGVEDQQQSDNAQREGRKRRSRWGSEVQPVDVSSQQPPVLRRETSLRDDADRNQQLTKDALRMDDNVETSAVEHVESVQECSTVPEESAPIENITFMAQPRAMTVQKSVLVSAAMEELPSNGVEESGSSLAIPTEQLEKSVEAS